MFTLSNGYVYRMMENESRWTKLPQIDSVVTLVADGQNILFARTQEGQVLRSVDKGTSWSSIQDFVDPIHTVRIGRDGGVYALSNHTIHRSFDSGASWTSIAQDFAGWVNFEVGPDGAMYGEHPAGPVTRSDDDGRSWPVVGSNGCGWCDKGYMAIDRRGAVFLQAVFLQGRAVALSSSDRGDSWSRMSLPTVDSHIEVTAAGLYAHSVVGLFESGDLGETWHSISTFAAGRLVSAPDGRLFAQAGDESWYQLTGSDSRDLLFPPDGGQGMLTSTSLEWAPLEGADRYEVQVASDDAFSDILFSEYTTRTRAYFVAPFTNRTYQWRLRSITEGEEPEWLPTRHFSVGESGPLVTGMNIKNEEDPRNMVMSWGANESAASYWLQVALDSQFTSIVVDVDSLVGTEYRPSGLSFRKKYHVRLAGVDVLGRFTFHEYYRPVETANSPVQPISPENGAEGVSSRPEFTWTPNPDATSYTIEVDEEDAFDYPWILYETVFGEPRYQMSQTLVRGKRYYWRVKAYNAEPPWGVWSDVQSFRVGVVTANEDDVEIPKEYSLYQNYPNPFNPTTTIRYDVPEVADVTLQVFDALGRFVETLLDNRHLRPGAYEVTWDANRHSSGIYFVHMEAGSYVSTKSMLLLR